MDGYGGPMATFAVSFLIALGCLGAGVALGSLVIVPAAMTYGMSMSGAAFLAAIIVLPLAGIAWWKVANRYLL